MLLIEDSNHMDKFNANSKDITKIVPENDDNSLNDEEISIIFMANNHNEAMIGEMEINGYCFKNSNWFLDFINYWNDT